MSRWFTYLLISLFLFSCTKKETLRVSVKNVVTGEPVVGNTISIVEIFNVSDGVSGSKTKAFYSGKTNSEGVLFVTEKFNKNRRYKVKVGKFVEDVCYINKSNENWYVGANTEINFEYAPCAYLKLKIENVNCGGGDDKMNFRSKSPYTEWGGWSTDRLGCYFYQSSNFFETSMGYKIYEWKVERNGVLTFHKDSIYLAPGNEYVFELNY